MKKRAVIIVLDSFGMGALPDSAKFGDVGSNTLGHIDQYCFDNGLTFKTPNLLMLGLGKAYFNVNNNKLKCDNEDYKLIGSFAACTEFSSGKDTTSGHWEMAGCPVLFDWGYFTKIEDTFPDELINKILDRANLAGFLGNCHASGTEIICQLGEEHIKTGFPIFYASADSVFQIACHEKHFGLENLYKLCQIAREELAPYNIARVIARPFIGTDANNFERTGNRKDYSLLPVNKTLLDICGENNGQVIAIGKIGDIYAHQGTDVEIKANGLKDLCDATIGAIKKYQDDKTIIMTNLVDFDMLYGHRRDIIGYKNALETFDSILPKIMEELTDNDILIITADHGCDPTWHGSDHTREYIPFLVYNKQYAVKNFGIRNGFVDIGQTVAKHLQLPRLDYGESVF